MPNFEENKKEDQPLAGTLEMVGAKPDSVDAGKQERVESYRDVGDQRLAKAAESIRGLGTKIGGWRASAWKKIKSFGSGTMEVGKAALSYTLAAPEMVSDAYKDTKEGIGVAYDAAAEGVDTALEFADRKKDQAIEGAKRVGSAAYEGAKDIGFSAAKGAFEAGVGLYDSGAEKVVYVKEGAKAAYEGALKFGRERMTNLQRRAEDARGIFQAAVNEARRRRQERIVEQGDGEYESALSAFEAAAARLQALESSRTPGGAEATV